MRVATAHVRSILIVLALALLGLSVRLLLHAGQPAKKIPHIGFLSPSWEDRPNSYEAELERALSLHGYVVGKDIAIAYRFAEGHDERLDAFATELVRDKPDAIVAINPTAALAAQRATRTIPIIFVAITNPVRMGLVQSWARPGGNMTGTAQMPIDLTAKRLEVLKDALPGLRRVAILGRTGNPVHQVRLPEEVAIATTLGLEARAYNAIGSEEFETVLQAMNRDDMQALVVMQDGVFFYARQRLFETALRHHLPVIADARIYAHSGALLAYGIADYNELIVPIAADLTMILQGVNPGDIPVDQPMDVGLAVNLGVAKALGVTIPPSLLVRASEVIE
jgi:putative tryptophan/tyrosine transport system substrate-binding protein